MGSDFRQSPQITVPFGRGFGAPESRGQKQWHGRWEAQVAGKSRFSVAEANFHSRGITAEIVSSIGSIGAEASLFNPSSGRLAAFLLSWIPGWPRFSTVPEPLDSFPVIARS